MEESRFYLATTEGEAMEIAGPPGLINVVEFLLATHPGITEGGRDTYVVSDHLISYATEYWRTRGLNLNA